MILIRANILLLAVFAAFFVCVANASYTATNLNVTVNLDANTSAHVTEALTISISNNSVAQYSTNRVALNLTLSEWQSLLGPLLVQHIMNPVSGAYNFKFFPGPVVRSGNQYNAEILLSYIVNNVTTVNQTAPRAFIYSFNPRVLNFEHGASGVVLSGNTTLTIKPPAGAVIKSVYPLPDYPPSAFTTGYANTTMVSWMYGEPLSTFTFTYVITEGVQAEVANFFLSIYKTLGAFTYVAIAAIVVGFILYTYFKAVR